MKETYREALKAVLIHEGGYTNHPADKGGPTNWGITIADARAYWKPDATAADVRAMPIDVAYDIYRKRYADAIRYDDLPAGLDYAVLDFGINSGVSRSVQFLQRILKVEVDGKMGLVTLTAAAKADHVKLINRFYDDRLKFLRGLDNYPTFGNGWERRCKEGRKLALSLHRRYPDAPKIKEPVPNLRPEDIALVDPAVIEGSDTVTDGGAKALPEEPTINPPTQSKTIWGGILGYFTGAGGALGMLISNINNKYALIAFGIILLVGSISLWLIIKGRIDIGKAAAQLKAEAA